MAAVESSPGILDISLYRGDTYYFTATVKGSSGTPMNLTGYNVKSEIYYNGNPLTLTNSISVISKQRTSGVMTLTTSSNHSFDTGQSVIITGGGTSLNGMFTITSLTDNTFSYASAGDDIPLEVLSPAAIATNSVKAEFQVGTGSLSSGVIYLFLPDGVTKQLPNNCTYDVEISKRINIDSLGDLPQNSYDDHWFVKTILKGDITINNDVTYSVTPLPSTRGQLT